MEGNQRGTIQTKDFKYLGKTGEWKAIRGNRCKKSKQRANRENEGRKLTKTDNTEEAELGHQWVINA